MKKVNNIKKIEEQLINRIKKEMSNKNISNNDIAQKLEVSKSTVSMWLSLDEEMTFKTVLEIANVLDIPFNELFNSLIIM